MVLLLAEVILVYPLGPYTLSAVWHLAHGNRVIGLGLSTPVPLGWFARSKSEGLSLVKVSPVGIPLMFRFETIDLRPLPRREGLSQEEIEDLWRSGAFHNQIGEFVVKRSQTLRVAGREAVCRETIAVGPKDRLEDSLAAVCVIRGTIAVYFWGERNRIPEFCNLLEGIRALPEAPGL